MSRTHKVHTPGAPAAKPTQAKPDTTDQDAINGAGQGGDSGASSSVLQQGQGGGSAGVGTKPEGDPDALGELVQLLHTRVDDQDNQIAQLQANFDQLAKFVVARLDGSKAPAGLARDTAAPRHSRETYAQMRAHEVDPKAITAPVLTADGHVVPDTTDRK